MVNKSNKIIPVTNISTRPPFPCNACGKCCQRVGNSEQTKFLDQGDGTCRFFDLKTKLCTIYENRPIVCRVEDYYEKYLKNEYKWEDFIKLNLDICNKL